MKNYVIFIVCLCVVVYGGFAKTIRVPENYRFIQEAIDAAQPGDEILLGPHIFKSGASVSRPTMGWRQGRLNAYTLVINKDLIIRGSGISQTYLDGDMNGSSIIIGASAQVTIAHLTIRQIVRCETQVVIKDNAKVGFNNVVFSIEKFTVEGEADVYAQSARFTKEGRSLACIVREEAMFHLTHCVLEAVKGIWASGDSKLYVDHSELTCEWSAISAHGQLELTNSQISGDIDIGASGKAVINNCSVQQVEAQGGSVEVIRSNISGIVGLNVRDSGTATVKDSIFSGNGTGIRASESSQITVESCTISDNETCGISLLEAHAVITNCYVNNNGSDTTGVGINLYHEATALITGCVINNNRGWGIRAVDSSVAIGWENSLSGNPRDLYGVSQLLTKSKPLENRTSSVAVPQDAPTLQEAVYMVSEGGTIDIAAGVYTAQERLVIYKSVTLRGAGPEQTELSKLGISIFPDVERVTLSNCAVSGESEQTGLVVGGSVQVHIEDCTFSSLDTGISVRGSGQVTLIRSIVSNNQYGIESGEDASLEVNDSRISDNVHEGIIFCSSGSVVIDHCYIVGNGSHCYDTENFAIQVTPWSQVRISHCEISQNICGGINMFFYGEPPLPEVNLSHNKIFANGYGIWLCCQGENSKISLSHNEIFANERGIVLCIDPGNDAVNCEVYGSANEIHDNETNLRPSLANYPWPAGFESPPVEDTIPPTCVMHLRQQATTSQIEKTDVGQSFDIYVGDSSDNTSIEGVRFSSDESQDGSPAGEWTEWYDWDTSSGYWDSGTKTIVWIFTASGEKEVWAEVRNDADQTSQCYISIYVNPR